MLYSFGGEFMDKELISKKELLELTGISYGQLYRWKRKGLIPESWFIKKSSYTGQETFFPKSDILQRIEKIKNLKDEVQLDELVNYFSNIPTSIEISVEEITKLNIISSYILKEFFKDEKIKLNFYDLLYLFIVDRKINDGDMNIEEAKILYDILLKNHNEIINKNYEIIFIRKMGMPFIFIISSGSIFITENHLKVVFRIDIQKFVEELKLNIKEIL
jgi:predicted DNA-binding transcriptional regulator AlpA